MTTQHQLLALQVKQRKTNNTVCLPGALESLEEGNLEGDIHEGGHLGGASHKDRNFGGVSLNGGNLEGGNFQGGSLRE